MLAWDASSAERAQIVIKQALRIRSICSDSVLSKQVFAQPLLVADLKEWFVRNVLEVFWDQLLQHGRVLLGEPAPRHGLDKGARAVL